MKFELDAAQTQNLQLRCTIEQLQAELNDALTANAKYASVARSIAAKYDALAAQLGGTSASATVAFSTVEVQMMVLVLWLRGLTRRRGCSHTHTG